MKQNTEIFFIVCADIRNQILRINKEAAKRAVDLSSVYAVMINQYRHMYPNFKIELV